MRGREVCVWKRITSFNNITIITVIRYTLAVPLKTLVLHFVNFILTNIFVIILFRYKLDVFFVVRLQGEGLPVVLQCVICGRGQKQQKIALYYLLIRYLFNVCYNNFLYQHKSILPIFKTKLRFIINKLKYVTKEIQ